MSIVMEYIEGERVRDVLSEDIARQIGSAIGKLHGAGLIHGDITTSNMIMKNGKLYFIDFGLGEFSKETEAFAVDLHLFKECLKSVHYEVFEKMWSIIHETYSHPDRVAILKKIEEIEKRGRYHER
jgi:TP53 regulating kinase-like protein